jgi:2,3-bisphosphoglycerate-independent phosphoglycerate mutase
MLKKLNGFQQRPGPLLFIIMDGMGIGRRDESNAIFLAKTPNLDKYFESKLYTQLKAHGKAVGLPADTDMGNSEVGHNALGAGRVFAQGAKLVDQACQSKNIFKNKTWQKIVKQCTTNDSALHLIGLLSDGNVHSHINHLLTLIEGAKQDKISKIYIHTLLDGRDVGEKTALIYVQQLEAFINKINTSTNTICQIASGGGRMVTTMDRYFADWDVVKRGWAAHVYGEGRQFRSAKEAIETYYNEDPKITDQYLHSFVIAENGQPVGAMKDKDCVVFYNFRGDRAIEISLAFEQEDFKHFERKKKPDVFYAGMMQYDGDLLIPTNYLVEPPAINNTISEYLCAEKITSFAIAETQKFGHVTYFWNGNKSGYICNELEKYVEIPSDKIMFDKKPAMKAYEVTEEAEKLLLSGKYQFGRINFANGDMVGHTGVMTAAIKACETVDECVGRLVALNTKLGGITVITADHGNADEMLTIKNRLKQVKTSHTLMPVPFVIIDAGYNNGYELAKIAKPGLANVAATLMNLLGFQAPKEYEDSLINFS